MKDAGGGEESSGEDDSEGMQRTYFGRGDTAGVEEERAGKLLQGEWKMWCSWSLIWEAGRRAI